MGAPDFQGEIDGVGYKASMDDPEKPPMGLIPPVAKREIARVLGHGAEKYSRGNWMRGMHYSHIIDAIHRHLDAFAEGEDVDPDSGLHPLAHAGCGIVFLLHYCLSDRADEYEQFDDRMFAKGEAKRPRLDWYEPTEVHGSPEVPVYSDTPEDEAKPYKEGPDDRVCQKNAQGEDCIYPECSSCKRPT